MAAFWQLYESDWFHKVWGTKLVSIQKCIKINEKCIYCNFLVCRQQIGLSVLISLVVVGVFYYLKVSVSAGSFLEAAKKVSFVSVESEVVNVSSSNIFIQRDT